MNRSVRHLLSIAVAFGHAFATEPRPEEYEIWNAALRSHNPNGTVYVWHAVEPISAFQRIAIESAIASFPQSRPMAAAWEADATELDIRLLDAAAELDPNPFIKASPYAVLDQAQLEKIAGKTPKSNWLLSPKLIPGAEAIYRLSRPVIREDGRVAYLVYVMCTEWWGAVMTCQVNKDFLTGKWRLGSCGRRDYTDWKDGKLLFEDDTVDSREPCSCH
jgi:hypothetical protein